MNAKKNLKREKVSDDVSNDFDNIADKSCSVSMLFYIVNFVSFNFLPNDKLQNVFFF